MKLEKFFIDTLISLQSHSTCKRLKVAALIVKDSRIISMGINGVPSGFAHCCDIFHNVDLTTDDGRAKHLEFSNTHETHAEQNAIGYAARNGIKTNNCDMYVSISPCNACAKLIIAAGIKNVYYLNEYDRPDMSGIIILKQAKINVLKI